MDIHWMDHLDTMEHLRSSVSLRGYGQHDPLVEYKREGLRLFRDLEQSILATAANFLVHSLKESLKNQGFLSQDVSTPAPAVINLEQLKDQKEVGRNDLCPCGSGKKYKKCHGA
jgi:preprotein translocase subunit SecA